MLDHTSEVTNYWGLAVAIVISLCALSLFIWAGVRSLGRKASSKHFHPSSFDITPTNKDPTKGLNDYLIEIDEFLYPLGFQKEKAANGYFIYTPLPRLLGPMGTVEVVRKDLFIEVSGPSHILKMLQSSIGLGSVFKND